MALSIRLGFAPVLATSLFLLPLACEKKPQPDESVVEVTIGGLENYGDERIGYKTSADQRKLVIASSQSSDIYASPSDGGYYDLSGTGGTSQIVGSGGDSSSSTGGAAAGSMGGAIAMGGASQKRLEDISPKGLAMEPPEIGTSESVILENPFVSTEVEDTSTFSIDVDTGSYTLARAAINAGTLPNPESIRVEEFLNYFDFHYKQPQGEDPLSIYAEWSTCPWNTDRELLLVGVQGQKVELADQPPANLVFLLDVSGSMNDPMKLPLMKQGFRMLTTQLRDTDRVSVVVYAGADRVILDGARGSEKERIDAAISNLQAGGGTNGEGGLQKAYDLAEKHFIKGGNNRILLATDGDFNVGLSGQQELVDFISEKRASNVFLSVYGYGAAWGDGNYQDSIGEQLADNGNGIYFYIDGVEETRRAFMYSASGSLMTVAKDVKLQLEFNPSLVKGYRLIGYENRVLSNAAFSNDSVDAGELGAGLSVTALYEIIPTDSNERLPTPRAGSVQQIPDSSDDSNTSSDDYTPLGSDELVQVRLRYKKSNETKSRALVGTLSTESRTVDPSAKFLFAAGISELAMELRGSQYLSESRAEALSNQIARALSLDKEGAVEEARVLSSAAAALY